MPAFTLPRADQVRDYALGVALLPLCALFAFGEYVHDPNPPIVLVHAFDLIVHEAGHVFFRVLGRTMEIAGGSLLQLLLPALFVYQGVHWNHRAGTQLALLLLGQNFVDVSVYAADAQARALPLLADGLVHDWHWLLSRFGLLEATPLVAGTLYALAFVCWGLMLVAPRQIG